MSRKMDIANAWLAFIVVLHFGGSYQDASQKRSFQPTKVCIQWIVYACLQIFSKVMPHSVRMNKIWPKYVNPVVTVLHQNNCAASLPGRHQAGTWMGHSCPCWSQTSCHLSKCLCSAPAIRLILFITHLVNSYLLFESQSSHTHK